MRVARVAVYAPVTSFRHPFFVTGRQPTSLMPPPSTVLGHCASALGEWPDPETFFFGIHFTFRSRAQDLEHQHITEALGAKAKTSVDTPMGPARATTAITVQPVLRDFLFDVRMTLYLPPDLGPPFRTPVHTMVLGRSQDLAEVVSVDEVELVRTTRARLAHTLLPIAVRPSVRFGSSVLLTRHISPPPERAASFGQYIVLHEPVEYTAEGAGGTSNRAFLRVQGQSLDSFWCDPTVVDDEDFTRGVWLHRVAD
jgi:CRISPR-associated protein Cas5t